MNAEIEIKDEYPGQVLFELELACSEDPLSAVTGDVGQLIPEEDPLTHVTYVPVTKVEEGVLAFTLSLEQRHVLENNRTEEADPLSWEFQLPPPDNNGTEFVEENSLLSRGSINDDTQHVISKVSLPTTSESTTLLPKYFNMSFGEFTKEMQDRIHEIVHESLGLFQRDPREYHPFYLRIFKYVTIGQRLGYVSDKEDVVNSIWDGFLKFAKAKYESLIDSPVNYEGVKTPYATYLLTKKVVIDGKIVTATRDHQNLRKKKFKELESTAKRLKNVWMKNNSSEADIKEDVGTVLSFFKECQMITFPGDMIKMNNIWSKFLCTDKPSSGRSVSVTINNTTHQLSVSKLNKVSPSVTNQSPEIRLDESTEQLPGTEKGNRKSPRRRTVKIIVKPPSISSPPEEILSPPSSPCADPSSAVPSAIHDSKLLSEMVSNSISSNVKTEPLPSHKPHPKLKRRKFSSAPTPITKFSLFKKKKRKRIISFLSTITSQKSNVHKNWRQLKLEKLLLHPTKIMTIQKIKPKNVNITVNSKTLVKTSRYNEATSVSLPISSVKKSSENSPPGKGRVKVSRVAAGAAKKKALSSALAKTKRNALQVMKSGGSAAKKRGVTMSLEMLIKKGIKGLPPNKQKMKQKRRGNSKNVESNVVMVDGNKNTDVQPTGEAEDKQSTSRSVRRAGKGSRNRLKIGEKDDDSEKLKEDADKYEQCEFCSCLKLKGRRSVDGIWNHMEKEHGEHYEKWVQEELEKQRQISILNKRMLRRKAREEGVGPDWMIRKRQRNSSIVWKKYRVININCVVCHKSVSLVWMSQHLKLVHGIIENGGLWKCTICEDNRFSKFSTREGWMGHMDQKHGDQVNKDELMEIIKRINIRDANNGSLLPAQNLLGGHQEKDHESLIDPQGREQCNECLKFFDPSYLPVHQRAEHNPMGPSLTCPGCDKTYKAANILWDHYCQQHIQPYDKLIGVDPVPPELRHDIVGAKQPREHGEYPEEYMKKFCEVCGGEFRDISSLSRHMYKIHGEGQRKENYFQCEFCPKQFKGKDILDAHVRRIHEGLVKSKCPHCSRDVQTAGKLWKHLMEIHHVTAAEAAVFCEVVIIQCSACGQDLLADRQFANHVKTQHPKQAKEILSASKQLIKEAHSRRREAAPSSVTKRPRKVQRPEGMSPQEWYRQRNIQNKRELKLRCKENGHGPAWMMEKLRDAGKCPECGQECRQGLTFHRMRAHGVVAVGGYPCHIEGCNTVTKSKRSIRLHYRMTHANGMEDVIVKKRIVKVIEKAKVCTVYQCTICQQYLYYFDEIKVHMVASHPEIFDEFLESKSAPAPEFPCSHCVQICKCEDELRKHVEELHPEICWRCPVCSKPMLDPNDMDDHFITEHGANNGSGKCRSKRPDGGEMFLQPRGTIYFVGSSEEKPLRATEMIKDSKGITTKYKQMVTKCEICHDNIAILRLKTHFSQVHKIKEDKEEAFVCNKCPDRIEYRPSWRIQYLCHMHKVHGMEVDMEKIIEEVSKVQTKVHWSKLKVRKRSKASSEQEEDGSDESESDEENSDKDDKSSKRVAREKKVRYASLRSAKKRNYRKLAGEEDSSDDDDAAPSEIDYFSAKGLGTSAKSCWEVSEKGNNERTVTMTKKSNKVVTSSVQPVRVSTRKRKPPTKYCFDIDEDVAEDEVTSLRRPLKRDQCLSTRTTTCKFGVSDLSASDRRQKLDRRIEGLSKEVCIAGKTVEQDKMLVIRLERLPVEQLNMYLDKSKTLPDLV